MQHWPLTVTQIIQHAARWHGEQEVISRTVEVRCCVRVVWRLCQQHQQL